MPGHLGRAGGVTLTSRIRVPCEFCGRAFQGDPRGDDLCSPACELGQPLDGYRVRDLVRFADPATGRPVWGRVTEVDDDKLTVDSGRVRTLAVIRWEDVTGWRREVTDDDRE